MLRVPARCTATGGACTAGGLRRDGGRGAALEVRDRVARPARLQPVQHRPRRLLPRPRPDARRAARLLVGADVVVDGSRSRDHRDGRLHDPPPAAPLRIALAFWVSFAAAIGVLALTGHAMTARWHLGPISGFHFWWLLVTSPEVLVFLFFMITDPKTAPSGGQDAGGVRARARAARGDADRADDDRVVGQGCAALVARDRVRGEVRAAALPLAGRPPPRCLWAAAGIAVFAGVVAFSNGTANSVAARPLPPGKLPPIAILPSPGVQTQLDLHTAQLIVHYLVAVGPRAGRRHGTGASRRRHRPGTAVGRRPARRAHVLADADGGRRLGAPGGAAHRRRAVHDRVPTRRRTSCRTSRRPPGSTSARARSASASPPRRRR